MKTMVICYYSSSNGICVVRAEQLLPSRVAFLSKNDWYTCLICELRERTKYLRSFYYECSLALSFTTLLLQLNNPTSLKRLQH